MEAASAGWLVVTLSGWLAGCGFSWLAGSAFGWLAGLAGGAFGWLGWLAAGCWVTLRVSWSSLGYIGVHMAMFEYVGVQYVE